jgi:hypothetical protein
MIHVGHQLHTYNFSTFALGVILCIYNFARGKSKKGLSNALFFARVLRAFQRELNSGCADVRTPSSVPCFDRMNLVCLNIN